MVNELQFRESSIIGLYWPSVFRFDRSLCSDRQPIATTIIVVYGVSYCTASRLAHKLSQVEYGFDFEMSQKVSMFLARKRHSGTALFGDDSVFVSNKRMEECFVGGEVKLQLVLSLIRDCEEQTSEKIGVHEVLAGE